MGRIKLDAWPVRTYCPSCGKLCSHKVLSRGVDGTKRLCCKECGHEWVWVPKERRIEMAESERRAKRPTREVLTCPWCGREFVPHAKARNVVWCSSYCRKHGQRNQRSAIVGLIAQTKRLERRMREVT